MPPKVPKVLLAFGPRLTWTKSMVKEKCVCVLVYALVHRTSVSGLSKYSVVLTCLEHFFWKRAQIPK